MKKGLLVALLGIALVAVLALPQTASAFDDLDNLAEITSFTTASSTIIPVPPIQSFATVRVLGPATLVMVKLVENLSDVGPQSTIVTAIVGNIVRYTVAITNFGEDDVESIEFRDSMPMTSPGLRLCTLAVDGFPCEDPVWVSPSLGMNGLLMITPPVLIEDMPGDDIWVDGGGVGFETYLIYTAEVTP